jgi:site-specific recombinase XerD
MNARALSEQFLAYLEEGGKSSHTLRSYTTTLNQLLHYMDGSNTHFLTKEVVKAYWYKEVSSKSPNTKRLHYAVLNSFFIWCIDEAGVLTANPLKGNQIPKPKPKESMPRSLDKSTSTILSQSIKSLDAAQQAACALMQELGLRASEVCSLNLEAVEAIENGFAIEVKGKGGKTRILPLYKGAEHFQAFNAYVQSERVKRSQGPLFFNKWGNRLTYDNLQKLWDKKVSGNVVLHQLRHTVATNFINEGGSIYDVKDLLGHANINTSLIYAKRSQNLMNKNLERFQTGR